MQHIDSDVQITCDDLVPTCLIIRLRHFDSHIRRQNPKPYDFKVASVPQTLWR